MTINAVWHSTHRMPQRATLKERARWHVAHAKHCGCRPIPQSVQDYLDAPARSRGAGSRKETDAQEAIVGIADHGGWAILVTVAMVNGEPTVIDRRRVALIEEGIPTQPYHHDTVALSASDGEQLLRKVKRSVDSFTAIALDRLSADLGPAHSVSAIAIRQPPLDELPATAAEAHRDYYVFCRADAMLYHSAIVAAARERGWKVLSHRRGEEIAKAASALGTSTARVERLVSEPRSTLGPPWTAEHRNAFAAAIAGLKK